MQSRRAKRKDDARAAGSDSSTQMRKALLVCHVVVGKPHPTTNNMEALVSPPDGCDSVWGKAGGSLNFEEFVVYDNHAALPQYIMFY